MNAIRADLPTVDPRCRARGASHRSLAPLRDKATGSRRELDVVRRADFREIWYPRCGRTLVSRWLRPSDRQRVANAFNTLSAEARRNRCFGPKNSLSERELEFFTRFDPGVHAALCAVRWDEDQASEAEGVAAVRYVRDGPRSECAEVALTVVDGWQRCGIATRLTSQLLAVLPTHGITAVRLHWLQDNQPMERLIRRLLVDGRRYRENGVITGEFSIDTQQADAA